jgi:hypothetical protein
VNPSHLADLRLSGLSDETIASSGIYSGSTDDGKEILGFDPHSSGMVIPYQKSGDDGGNQHFQVKPDTRPTNVLDQ